MPSIATTLNRAKFVACIDMFKQLDVTSGNISKTGSVFTGIDPVIRRTVFVAQGAFPAANKYRVPANVNMKAFCQTHKYVFVQLASSLGGESKMGAYQFSLLCHSSSGTSVKVVFTNISCTEPKVTNAAITIPLELSRWSTLALDMEQIFYEAYRGAVSYRGVLQFEAMASTVIKGVYFCTKPFTPFDAPEQLFLPAPLEQAMGNPRARHQSDIPPLLRFYDWITVCFTGSVPSSEKPSMNMYNSNLAALWPKTCTLEDFYDQTRNTAKHPTGVSGEVFARVEIDTDKPAAAMHSGTVARDINLGSSTRFNSTTAFDEESFTSHIKRTRNVVSVKKSNTSIKTTIITGPSTEAQIQRRPASASASATTTTVPRLSTDTKTSSRPMSKQHSQAKQTRRPKSAKHPKQHPQQPHQPPVTVTFDVPLNPPIKEEAGDSFRGTASQSSVGTDENNAILSISDSRLRSDRCGSVETPLTAAICGPPIPTVPVIQRDPPESRQELPQLDSNDLPNNLTINQLVTNIGEKVDRGLQDNFQSFNKKMSSVQIILDKIYSQQKQVLKHINTATTSSFLLVNRVPLRYLTQASALEPQIAVGFQTTTRFVYSFKHKTVLKDPLSCRNVERALLDDQCSDDLCEEAACRILNAAFNMHLFYLREKAIYQEGATRGDVPSDHEAASIRGPRSLRGSRSSRPHSTKAAAPAEPVDSTTISILEQANALVEELYQKQLGREQCDTAVATPAQKLTIRGASKAFAAGQIKRQAYEQHIEQAGKQPLKKVVRVAEPLSLSIYPSAGIHPIYTGYPLVLCFLAMNYVTAVLSFYEYIVSHDGSYTVSPLRAQFLLSHSYCILCLSSMLLQDKHKNQTVALLKADEVPLSDDDSDSGCGYAGALKTNETAQTLTKRQAKLPGRHRLYHRNQSEHESLRYTRYKQYNGDLDEQSLLTPEDIRGIIDLLNSTNGEQYRRHQVLLIATAKYAPFVVVFFTDYLALFEVMPQSMCARLKALLFYNSHSNFPTTIQAASFSDDSSKIVIAGSNSTFTSIIALIIDIEDAIQESNEFVLLSSIALGDQLQPLLTTEPITHVLFRPGSNDQFITLSATQFRGWRIKYMHGTGYIKSATVEVCNKEVQANLTHTIKKYVMTYISDHIMQPDKANKRFLNIISGLIKQFSKVLFTDVCFSNSDRIQIATACGVILIFNLNEIIHDSSKIMLLLPSNTPDYRPLAACALSVNRAMNVLSDAPVENYIIFSSVDGVVRGWINGFDTLIMQSRFKAPVIYLREVILSGTSRTEADARTIHSLNHKNHNAQEIEKRAGIAADSQIGGFSGISRSSLYDDDTSKQTTVYNTAPANGMIPGADGTKRKMLPKYGPQTNEGFKEEQDIDAHLANNMYYLKGGPHMLRQGSSLIPDHNPDIVNNDGQAGPGGDMQEILSQLSYINLLGQKSRARQSVNYTESTGSQYPSVSIDTLFFDSGSDDAGDADPKRKGFLNSGFKFISSSSTKDPVLSTLRMHHNYGGNSEYDQRIQGAKEAVSTLNGKFHDLFAMQLKGNTQRLAFNSIGLSLPDMTTYDTKFMRKLQAPVSSGTFMSVCLNGDVGLLAIGDSKGPTYNTVLCTQYKSLLDARFDPQHNEAIILTSNVINVYDLATGLRSVYFKVGNWELESSALMDDGTSAIGKCRYHPKSYVVAVITSTLNCLLLDISNQAVVYSCNLRNLLNDASHLAIERSANAEVEMFAVSTAYVQSMHMDMSTYELDPDYPGRESGDQTDLWTGGTVDATMLDPYEPVEAQVDRPAYLAQPQPQSQPMPKDMNQPTNTTQHGTSDRVKASVSRTDSLSRPGQQTKRAAGSQRQTLIKLRTTMINYVKMITTGALERPLDIHHSLLFTPSGSHLFICIDNYIFATCTNGYAQLRLVHTNPFPVRQIVVGTTSSNVRKAREVLALINLRNEVLIFTIDDLLLGTKPKSLKITKFPQLACMFAHKNLGELRHRYSPEDLVPELRTPILIIINEVTASLLVLVVDSISLGDPSNISLDEAVIRTAERQRIGSSAQDQKYMFVYSLQSYSFSNGELQYELPFYMETDDSETFIPTVMTASQMSGAVALFFRGIEVTKMISIPLSVIAEAEMNLVGFANKLKEGKQDLSGKELDIDLSRLRHSVIEYPVSTVDHDLKTDRFLITGFGMQSAVVYTWNTSEYVEFLSLAQCVEHEEGYDELVRSYLIEQKIRLGQSLEARQSSFAQSTVHTDKESIVLTISA